MQVAVTGESAGDGTDASGNNNLCTFQSCKICRSELAAGGLKLQRKSMAYSIQAVQELHKDKRRWRDFKQNWNSGGSIDEDNDTNGGSEAGESHVTAESGEEKVSALSNHSETTQVPEHVLAEHVRDALLRGSQVQRWLLVEKTKEIESLKKQLEGMTMENHLLKKQMEDQKISFEETIRKQEKTIKQELKMIKSIASQRAGNRKSTRTSGIDIGRHSSQVSSNLHSSNASLSLSVSSHDTPLQLPTRKASDKLTPERKLSHFEEISSLASGPKDPPKLPIRQTSSQLKDMSKNESPELMERKSSIRSVPPSCPQRQASSQEETCVSSQDSVDTSSDGFLHKMRSSPEVPSTTSDTSLPSPRVSVSDQRSVAKSEAKSEVSHKSQVESSSSQEISFVPTNSERIVRSTSLNNPDRRLPIPSSRSNGSHEIEFDARAAFGANGASNSSAKEIKFDAHQQLLMEASQALTAAAHPKTPSQRHRKTPSKGSAEGSNDTPKEIKVGRSNGIIPMERKLPGDSISESDKGKSEEQILRERIFGKTGTTASEDEEYDEFDGVLPSEFPVNSERYLDCSRDTDNLSPVSALTSMSYLFDPIPTTSEQEEMEPRKGLQNGGVTKQLPMEKDFDSDGEDDDTKLEKEVAVTTKPQASAFHKPTPKSTKRVTRVTNQIVHDKYGDGGMFSGHVSVNDRLPHGFGKMVYENGREYEGDWKSGRWHGKKSRCQWKL
jgi:hypothetical protein